MTARDRYVIMVIAVVGVLGAVWFLGLSPKRTEVAKLDKDIAAAQQSLQTAEQEKVQFAQAQLQFPALYATVGRLGKAVPSDEDVPSLLVQLNHAAGQSGVDFRSIELKLASDQSAAPAPAAPAPAAAAASGTDSAAAGGSAAAGQSGATPSTGATGAAGAASATAPVAGDSGVAPASAVSASLQPQPFEYKFKGNFFDLKKMIAEITDLVDTRNRQVAVSGRLITVEGFTLKSGKVTVLATTYILPAGQSLFAGADEQGPSGIDPNSPQPASTPASPAVPTAAVTAP